MSETTASGGNVPARREVEGELMAAPEYLPPLGMRRLGRDEKLDDLPIGTVVIWYASGPAWAYEEAADRRQSGVIEPGYPLEGPNVIRAISTIYQENVVDFYELGESPVWVAEFDPAPGRNGLPPIDGNAHGG